MARCLEKEQYTNQALSAAERAGGAQDQLQQQYVATGYDNLARAVSESCTNTDLDAKWTVAEAWLGTYAVRDEVDDAHRTHSPACKSLYMAQAREGLVLSWIELIRTHNKLAQTRIFKHAKSALDHEADALSMKLPPSTADQAVIDSLVRLRKADTAQALNAASNASCGEETIKRIKKLSTSP